MWELSLWGDGRVNESLYEIFKTMLNINEIESLYEGKDLKIAVVGVPPKIKEKQVEFTKISFEELTSKELDSYDAVFIMEDNLQQASESQYADIYLNSTIPFFFIGAKSYLPFTEKDLEFEETWKWNVGDIDSYAFGVLTSREEVVKGWGFGLYNDKKTDEHIENMYSKIFKTIDELNL